MEWFILSRDMHVLCAPSTDSPDSLPIFNDKQTLLLSNNTVVSTYDFSVQRKHPDAQYLQMGNYIVFVDKYHKTKMYTLMSHDGDDLTDTWHAEDVGLDLLNESSEKWDYTGHPHDIAWYLNNLVIGDSGWTIGINEASTLSRALKFDGETDTQLRRLGDIANQFDGAEVDFTIEMNGAKVTKQVINIYKKVGSSVTQGRYIDSINLTSLHSSGSIADLVTALKPFGGQIDMPEGQEGEAPRINIADVAYDDGRYYSPKGHVYLYDREAHQQWSRFRAYNYANQGEFDGYIVGSYTYDTKDPNELLNRALTELKSRNKPSETYEANLLDINADIGDYVQIAHNQYNPPIYLSARVEQVENCYTANGQDIGVLGDYRKLESNIDPRIKEMLSALENQIKAHYMWIRYAEDDKGKGMTSVPTVNTKYVVILVNKPTAVPSDNPADYAGHWQLIQGQDGTDGIPGPKGADGKTSYTHFAYADNVSGTADFSLDDPTGRSYMGVYSDFTKADSTNPSDYVWSYTKGETGPEGMQGVQGPKGDIGIPGKPGADGKTSYTHVAYADNDKGGGFSQNPANKAYMGWYTDFTANDSTDTTKYAWSLIKGSDGLDGAQGIAGPKGADGKTPYTHIAYADTATGGGLSQLPDGKKYIGMYVDFTENDSGDPQKYAWSLIKGADGKDGTPGKDGIAGKDGIGIKSTTVTYQASSNGTTAPTGAWTANVPTVPAGQYLWTRTIWTYTDNTSETSYSVAYIAKDGNSGKDGIAGKDGVGIKSTTITYATSTSGTVTPASGWVANPPAVSPGQFMWTKTVWSYTDNSSETGYSVAQAGNTGATGPVGKDGIAGKDGVGIKSTAIAYAQSTSGTTPPTTGWTAGVPTLIKGQYLWTKTVWTYTDSSAETGYTVSYNAKDGNNGSDGVAGKDGVGISNTIIEYVGAVSGTSNPTSGWSTTIPAVPAGQYLWTRTTWKYTDGTSEQGFTNALMGRTGPKGDTGAQGLQGLQGPTGTQGIAGPKGLDGKSSYTHIAYANSSDSERNMNNWMLSEPAKEATTITYKNGVNTINYTGVGDYEVFSMPIHAKVGNNVSVTFAYTQPAVVKLDGSSNGVPVSFSDHPNEHTAVGANPIYLGVNAQSSKVYTISTMATSETMYLSFNFGYLQDGINWKFELSVQQDFSQDPGKHEYMGWYSDFTALDSNDPSFYGWSLIKGADGAQGTPGAKGADGKTPYFHSAWANSADGKTGFSTTDSVNKSYLGTYTDFTVTDSADPTKYAWSLIKGADGINGKDGIPGKTGADGKTPYFHTAWADSVDGKINFSLTDATNRGYLGTYTDFTQADSTDTTKYAWSLIKGRDGSNGAPGKAGTDGKTPYFHQAWADSKDGKVNFNTTDPTNRGYLGTYSDFTQADSSDPTKYFWVELVGNLAIGGRNYLADTDTSWQAKGSGGANQTSSMKWLFTFGTIKQAPFKDGDYVTLSFDYTNVGTGAYGAIYPQFNNAPWGQFNSSDAAMKDNGHVVYTVQWRSDWTTSGTATGIQIRMDNVATTRTVTVYNMQFERGNKDTDHKSAPEDTQGQIDTINQGLRDTNGKIAAVTKVDSQATAPTNPKKGDQWWVKDANGNINAFKIWDGTKWADSIIQQSAMNISTLNGNIINGATINSSNFNVSYDETATSSGRPYGPYFKGTQVIKNGSYLSNYQVKGSTQTGYTHLTPDGLQSRINNNDGSLLSEVTMGQGSLSLQDATHSGELYPGDVERTNREVWTTHNPLEGDYQIGFMKQFRRVWLDGVVSLIPSGFPSYKTLFKLQNKKLYPSHTVFISMNELGNSPSTVATIQVDTNGLVQITYSGTTSRYIAEGHFYLLD